jgi:hypothetical protein
MSNLGAVRWLVLSDACEMIPQKLLTLLLTLTFAFVRSGGGLHRMTSPSLVTLNALMARSGVVLSPWP